MLITTSGWGPEKYPHKVKKVFRKKAPPHINLSGTFILYLLLYLQLNNLVGLEEEHSFISMSSVCVRVVENVCPFIPSSQLCNCLDKG